MSRTLYSCFQFLITSGTKFLMAPDNVIADALKNHYTNREDS